MRTNIPTARSMLAKFDAIETERLEKERAASEEISQLTNDLKKVFADEDMLEAIRFLKHTGKSIDLGYVRVLHDTGWHFKLTGEGFQKIEDWHTIPWTGPGSGIISRSPRILPLECSELAEYLSKQRDNFVEPPRPYKLQWKIIEQVEQIAVEIMAQERRANRPSLCSRLWSWFFK